MDIGCGPGYLSLKIREKFPGLKIIALDLSEQMIKLADKNRSFNADSEDICLLVSDAGHLPLDNNSVDFVFSTLSLHHWNDASRVLKEFYRVLRPGGGVYIFDLRRDAPLLAFHFIQAAQRFLAPVPIRRVNGGIGSFWSSYTPAELEVLLSSSPFPIWTINRGWSWVHVKADKGLSGN